MFQKQYFELYEMGEGEGHGPPAATALWSSNSEYRKLHEAVRKGLRDCFMMNLKHKFG